MADLTTLDASTDGGATALQRLGQFQSTYSWVPFQTLYSLVNSGLSDGDIGSTLGRLTQTAVQSDQQNAIKRASSKTLAPSGSNPFGSLNPTAAQQDQTNRQTVKKYTQPTNFSFKQFFDDPVLQKAPSAGLALKQYLSGAVGNWPVGDQDLIHQQQQLQVRGYGRTLPIDGAWNQAWDAAYRQYAEQLYNTHLTGAGGGSASLKQVMSTLSALQPTGAFDALWGFIKSIPSDVRDTMADFAGSVAGSGYGIYHTLTGTVNAAEKEQHKQIHGDVAASVINALGGDSTGEKERRDFYAHPLGHLVRDASTILMLTSLMGAGKRFATSIGEEAALSGTEAGARLTAQEAMHGPGVIARTLGSPGLTTPELSYGTVRGTRIARGLAGGALGGAAVTATGSDNPSEILAGIAGGAFLGGLSAGGTGPVSRVFNNFPILGNTGPIIDSLASGDGLYYKTRNLLAIPYKYAPVRVAGAAFQNATFLGAEARGLAALQSGPLGEQNAFTQGVQGEHTFDAFNDAIKHRLDFTVLGQHIAPSLDDLQFFLHGPSETFIKGTGTVDELGNLTGRVKVPEAKLSGIVGQSVSRMMDAYSSALGDPGFSAAVTRITGKNLARNIRDAGGVQNYNEFWGDKLAMHASYQAAERARQSYTDLAGMAPYEGFSDPDRLAWMADKVAEIRSDPTQLTAAIRDLRAQGNGTGLDHWVQRVNREIAHNTAGPKASEYNNVSTYMDAMRLARTEIHPRLRDLVPGEENAALGSAAEKARRVFPGANDDPGKFGLAKLSQLDREEGYMRVADLEARYPQPSKQTVPGVGGGIDFTARQNWEHEMDRFLYEDLGIDAARIPERDTEKLEVARDAINHLAVRLHPHPDAAPEVTAAIRRLEDLGYKPVTGTNIGHIITGPTPLDMAEGPLTYTRRVAEHLGLSSAFTTGSNLASYRTTGAINAIDDTLRSGAARINAPNVDANTIVAMIEADRAKIQAGETPFIDRASYLKDTARQIARTAKRQAKARGIEQSQVEHELQQGLGGFTDLTEHQFVNAMLDRQALEDHFPSMAAAVNAGDARTADEITRDLEAFGTTQAPLMDRTSARAIYAAYRTGYYSPPGYMIGAERIEELARTSLGFMGDVGQKIGAPNLGFAVANLPNRLIQLRNDLRFDLDPWFSLKRILKTNAKLGVEGIPWTVNPLKVMNERGTRPEDISYFEHLFPQASNAVYDEGARYLHSQDVFGLYNPHDYASMAAGEWKRQGFTDTEIRDKIVRTFEYGKDGVTGRTPLERTANFFFFPFSFEKTVMRNLGGYLLDHPAQRVLLTGAMAAYDDFNQNHADNPLSTEFMKAHAPILQEAANLNMFAHGLGLGQPGGINRPLLNLFLPQSWDPAHPDIMSKLKGFIPVVKNFQRLYSEVAQQGSVMVHTMDNMYQDLKGTTATFAAGGQWGSVGPRQSTLTKSAQLTEAFDMQRSWYENYAAVIDHNAKTQDPGQKIRFELDPRWGKYAGEPITKNVIRHIIQGYYPEYSATGAVTAATDNSDRFQQYLLDTKNTPLHDYVVQFSDNAHNLGNGMNSSRFSGQDVANYTAALRAQAVYIAEHDSKFFGLYNANFRKILGPLEKVT